MKLFWIVLLTTMCLPRLIAQVTYPLHIGNVWQYRDPYDTLSKFTTTSIKDTIMPNGLSYTMLLSDQELDTLFFRQSASQVYNYSTRRIDETTYVSSEELWFDFSKTVGDTIAVRYSKRDTVTFTMIYDGNENFAGSLRRTMVFFESSKRTSIYAIRQITDGIGLTYYQYDPGVTYGLWGAIINGTKYGTITQVQNQPQSTPSGYALLQNFSNPFNSSTTIGFTIPNNEYITLKIYNMLGQETATIAKGSYSAGEHQLRWNFDNTSSGIYFYRLETNNWSQTRKLILMK